MNPGALRGQLIFTTAGMLTGNLRQQRKASTAALLLRQRLIDGAVSIGWDAQRQHCVNAPGLFFPPVLTFPQTFQEIN